MSDDLNQISTFIDDVFIDPKIVTQAYDNFWTKKQLGVDANGKIYRTELDRKRPKNQGFNNHNWMFNKSIKIKVDNEDASL
ncbi:MAG: hypothetical protein GOVbin4318_32 [Prokaryotic dsDNA virus sp.]|nr:MAG: hypothetical protein GOVbin4318_32 [Prokaryotic dsDNA virus sp.]|tara:strand:+ start:26669 stop:26911 length:243 start_codon:yes stop_codon:yes gene_type:complete